MCSGCSDYYEDDGNVDELGSEPQIERESGVERFGSTVGDSEDCEVLVSEYRIVEQRIIAANPRVLSTERATNEQPSWQENQHKRQHFEHENAKSYRTGRSSDAPHGETHRSASKCFALWGLAGAMAAALACWLAAQ
jgi:hypothetical protein